MSMSLHRERVHANYFCLFPYFVYLPSLHVRVTSGLLFSILPADSSELRSFFFFTSRTRTSPPPRCFVEKAHHHCQEVSEATRRHPRAPCQETSCSKRVLLCLVAAILERARAHLLHAHSREHGHGKGSRRRERERDDGVRESTAFFVPLF